jgi:hypothetical protein
MSTFWIIVIAIAVVCAAIFIAIMAKGWHDGKMPRDYDNRMDDICKGRHTYRGTRKHNKAKAYRHAKNH